MRHEFKAQGHGDFREQRKGVTKVSAGFIKVDRMKHISPNLFGFMQDLVETNKVEVKKIDSTHNIVNMVTKAIPSSMHMELVCAARICSLRDLV